MRRARQAPGPRGLMLSSRASAAETARLARRLAGSGLIGHPDEMGPLTMPSANFADFHLADLSRAVMAVDAVLAGSELETDRHHNLFARRPGHVKKIAAAGPEKNRCAPEALRGHERIRAATFRRRQGLIEKLSVSGWGPGRLLLCHVSRAAAHPSGRKPLAEATRPGR